MDIFLDLEKTLLNNQNNLSKEAYTILENLSKKERIFILTTSPLYQTKVLWPIQNLTVVSTLENKTYQNGTIESMPMEIELASLLDNPYLYTIYTIIGDTCYIHKYQERLKPFYPSNIIGLWPKDTPTICFLVIAVWKEGLKDITSMLSSYSLEVLAEDAKKVLLKVTTTPSTKETWLKKLKESPSIGIGDSLKDYDFIKHCDIQVAMQNGETELKELCSHITKYSNQEAGALEFLFTYLKHQQA